MKPDTEKTETNATGTSREIEVYVHSVRGQEPQLLKIREDATIEEFLIVFDPEHHMEFLLFIEEKAEPVDRHHRLHERGIHHRKHVHCHKCRHIHVVVSFNGRNDDHNFSPATTVERVLKWSLNAFSLSGADAARKVLRLAGKAGDPLPEDAHIGSFASPENCSVHLDLADDRNVNG